MYFPQAAAQASKNAVITGPEEGDPLGSQYGDQPRIQSSVIDTRTWTDVKDITKALEGQQVRLL